MKANRLYVVLGLVFAGFILIVVAIALGDSAPHVPPSTLTSTQTDDARGARPQKRNPAFVRAKDVPWIWPLVSREATITCSGAPTGPNALTVTIAGTQYALNGVARSAGYQDLGAHWLDDDTGSGGKVSLRDLTTFALSLCTENAPDAKVMESPQKLAVELGLKEMQRHVVAKLKDPASAQFRNLTYEVGRHIGCGQVNAKNAFGGYTGFHYFSVLMAPGSEPDVWIDSGEDELAKVVCTTNSPRL